MATTARTFPSAAAVLLASSPFWPTGCVESGNLDVSAESAAAAAAESACANADDVCRRWTCAHASVGRAAAAWKGDAAKCDPAAIDEQAKAHALRLINTYRALAGVPSVVVEPSWQAPAQDCALLAHANRKLSHEPPPSWSCWSERGARASAVSLVANRSAPNAIDAFVWDPGNEPSMVHRRWLLSEKVSRIGVGSTDAYSCILVDGRAWDAPKDASTSNAASVLSAPGPWVAWPPPGPVPLDALARTEVDRLGWTVQSSTLDLDDARITVRADGALLPVRSYALERTLGSLTAVRFVPDGWSSRAGARYEVRVENEGTSFDYVVAPVSCP